MAVMKILRVLSDGEFHSGEELGAVLGVSRTAVWKHLHKLADLGLELVSVKGRGYCIEGGLDLLNSESITKKLSAGAAEKLATFDVFSEIDSTNSFLLSKNGSAEVCLAERQTAGRGRRGRQWVSPFAKNIYFSMSWVFSGGAQVLEGLSLAVGVKVVAALESLGLKGLQLKWPNDVLIDGKKVGGILLEMSGDVSGDCRVVVGIGLNLQMPQKASADIDQAWADLASLGYAGSRNDITCKLIDHLVVLLDGYSESGFEVYRQEWESFDAFRGKSVKLISADKVEEGVAVGVSASGALLLEQDGYTKAYSGGELSLRLAV